MSLKIKDFKEFKNANYLTLCNDDDEELLLTSNKNYLSDLKFANGPTVTFELSRSRDEVLFKKVVGMEDRIAKTLKTLDPEIVTKLSTDCQKILSSGSKNFIYNIRSNFYGFQGDPIMYLKGNWKTIKLVNFKNETIQREELGNGNYQFIIRANMIYLGPHKKPEHIANLQLRITEIRFEPLKAQKHRRASKRKLNDSLLEDPKSKNEHFDEIHDLFQSGE